MLVSFSISYKIVLYLILCFYFSLKRSSVLQFMNSSSFWTNLNFNAHQKYYVLQHNFASHFFLAPGKTNPQPVPVGVQNTSLCFCWPSWANWHLTREVFKNTQTFKNAFPVLYHLFQKKMGKKVTLREAVYKRNDWGEERKETMGRKL